ncbi:hypothetical protein [Paenarthrobacter nicotinovorans]|uniref:hypothetical protein n=1 Tax=Paenarthrobacter nicotinovorans TaxID=29320 RepID=UPI0007CD3C65|nr:hypothetical protein [Paenarthrobacter nicotinovorans]MBP2393479.1 hypothetical protein [Paenarthrobacter nicotinovorans]UKF00264.1 hypothetical protein LU808_05505 [Paenarthrobacter nicotinovorans]UKF05046.1 hypothetical protein JMY29_05530 [Paenarthrobacter nicotinovorans]GAT86574.1 hypothetical protein CVCC1112_1233 [Paenarthrobacter nicotinovorans]GGV32679.1 hypothetical protein GCM10010212_20460 [Paenarthrobacter nicotinovorans]
MENEIQLISDGDGLAVIGDSNAVQRFLTSEGLTSKDLGLQRLGPAIGAAAGALQSTSEIAANSGRWVKLTKESAELVKKYGLMKSSSTGLNLGVVQAKGGQIKGIVQFAKVPGTLISNPAVLSGAAGIMSQVAMQQAMNEITDYLAAIDEKVDDLLRAQKDAVFAAMIGVDIEIEEALLIREHVGKVSETTWSKVQATSTTLKSTQGYALRQLDALAEKIERKSKLGEVAEVISEIEPKVREWLAVLARCFQLQDAVALLELDRVLDASPGELDRHRLGLKAARHKRLSLISQSTERLLSRMDAAAEKANAKVLLHPGASRAVVSSSNRVATGVVDFHGSLGLERGRPEFESKRWIDAAAELRDRALETGAGGVDAARRMTAETVDRAKIATDNVLEIGAERFDATRRAGRETLDEAKSATGKFSSGFSERVLRWRGEKNGEETED